MKIFLDTADIVAIRKYAAWGVVDGVTTNPTLVAREGVDMKTRIMEIAEVVDGPISGEVVATDFETMLEEARIVASWHPNIFVKLPTTEAGLKVLSIISKEGIKTNMTLVFSLSQALLVAKAGATIVSPFVGRYEDMGGDGIGLIADIVDAFAHYGFKTEVLAASFRRLDQIKDVARVGSHIATISPKFMDEMLGHKMTDMGLAGFVADAKEAKISIKK